MKATILFIAIAGFVFAMTSCNSNTKNETANSNETAATTPGQADNKPVPASASINIPNGMESIIGEWSMVKQLRDENGNHKIDPEDEKTTHTDIEYILKFNADGTCKFETVMDGKYEMTTADDGRVKILINDLQGTRYPFDLYVNSITANELVLNRYAGGWDFQIFKRTSNN